MHRSLTVLTVLSVGLVAFPGAADPIDNLDATVAGADRLMDLQFANGAFPWLVGSSGAFQNVQGITAIGLVRAYDVTLDGDYIDNGTHGAKHTRDWLVDYMDANPGAFISASNAFFLADYARATLDPADYDEARRAMNLAIARYGNAEALADGIITARLNQGHTNLGLWDVALFVRAAQEVGFITFADELMTHLLDQEIVNARDTSANWFELGLAGILFATAESGPVDHPSHFLPARQILLAQQCEDGSFPTTWQGTQYCSDVQSTAYAVLGLTAFGDISPAQAACDFLAITQESDGSWDLGGYEIAEVDSEAVAALAACIAPLNNAVTSNGDMLRGHL